MGDNPIYSIVRYLLILLLTGCSVDYYAGISYNDKTEAQKKAGLVPPLGIVRVEYKTEGENMLFCEHISSISENDKSHGMNHCGALLRFK